MNSKHDYQSFLPKDNDKVPTSLTVTSQSSQDDQLDLGWLFAVIRRRLFAMVMIGVALVGSLGSLVILAGKRQPPIFEGYFQLLVEPITAEGQVERIALTKDIIGGSASIQNIQPSRDGLDYETLVLVMTSPKLIMPVFEQIKAKYPTTRYGDFFSNITIERLMVDAKPVPKGTKIIDVRYRDLDPQKAEYVVKLLSKSYLDYSRLEPLASVKQGIGFIEKQLPGLEARANIIQSEIQKLREKYNLINPETAAPGMAGDAKLVMLNRLSLETQLANARTLKANLQKHLDNGNVTAILSGKGGSYDVLVQQLQNVESKIAVDSTLLREDSPPLQSLSRQQQNLQALALQEARKILQDQEAQVESLEKQYATVRKTEVEMNQKIEELPAATRLYSDLQRELTVVTDTISEFLAKREGLQLKSAQGEAPWRLVESPVLRRNLKGQPESVAPRQTTRQLALVIVLSTLFSIGAGFLIEVLIKVFHTPDEVKNATKLPIVGIIPFIKEFKQAAAPKHLVSLSSLAQTTQYLGGNNSSDDDTPIMIEAFRSLYTNIRLLGDESSFHSLVISSAGLGDGKTTVAVHLAKTAATVGQRILLVDTDLRDPQLHLRLNLPNVRGLSDVVNTDLSLNDAIQRAPSTDNLFVLTSGNIPPDPIKMLSSKKMRYLMEQFQAFFDLVIYDTPALVDLADGSLVASHTDGIVLVVSIEKTDRTMLTRAMEGLKISGTPILGVVANGVKKA